MTLRPRIMLSKVRFRTLLNRLTTRFVKDHLPVLQGVTQLEFCRPGLRFGPLPIRQESTDRRSWLDRVAMRCLTYRKRQQYTEVNSSDWLSRIALRKESLCKMTPSQFDTHRETLMQNLRHGVTNDDTLDDALVQVLIAVEETHQLVIRPNQCLAARAMLQGCFVEMATGEGKTLSVAIAAGAAALSGTPVHVLTANDYLAARDAAYLQPIYQLLGLQVASAVSDQKPEERRKAYKANIVYVTAKQVAFDWLNDTMELGTVPDSLTSRLSVLSQPTLRKPYVPMLRGLCLAIVDEADSLLVDEARIPLVLAATQSSGNTEDVEAAIALGLAEQLREDIDYTILSTTKLVQLTDSGCSELSRLSQKIAHVWQSSRFREERVGQALTALRRFERDRDYIVREGRLELMDAQTGRAMPDRRLPHGMHRLLELKEKCTPTPQHETIATIPFQHFFRHYLQLTGISGTLCEVAGEIHHVYDRLLVQIQSHRPSQRIEHRGMVFADRATQLQYLVNDVQQRQALNQPVLVCTRSVEQSLGVSAMLTAHGLTHQVLNAYQDAEEAAIVAAAGKAGQITVATNMAGRGTDIPLDTAIADVGGLHVASLAFNDARRLDRQLAGRAARQGDPGSYQRLLSLDDPYVIEAIPAVLKQVARTCVRKGWHRAALVLIHSTQCRLEYTHGKERLRLFQSRENLERQVAFGGRPDYLS